MWTPTEFSYRKFKRKAEQTGYSTATLSAAELLSRKTVLWPIVDRLCDRGMFDVCPHAEFHSLADPLLSVTDESEPYGGLDAPFVASIGSGYVLTETGLVTTKEGRIVNQSLFPPERGRRFVVAKLIWQLFFESIDLTTSLARKNITRLDTRAETIGICAPLIPRYSNNYYHWLIETVPKIRYIRKFEEETGLDVTYLVPGDAPSWLDETLQLLKIPAEKVERASSSVYRAENLVLTSFPLQSKQDYEWIVQSVLENAEPDRGHISAGSNVYISRSKAVERRVTNEDEVMDMLSQYNFERYHLEDLSVEENVTLFNEANIIVGAHGAGLTDIIYSADVTVVELFGSKMKEPYKTLSETMGHEYMKLECTPASTDIKVDLDVLEEAINYR